MRIQQRLSAEELACQIIYSYFYILDRFPDDYEQKRGLSKWRLEIFDYIKIANSEDLNYILNYLKKESSVVYLEILTMASELAEERKIIEKELASENLLTRLIRSTYNKIITYINTMKEGINDEKICADSSVFIGGSCDADGYPRTNRSID